MATTDLLEAIHIVKENERIASESYAQAISVIRHPQGKDLFRKLSMFEKFHYDRISALEKSLQENGEFIKYEGMEFPRPPIFEIKAAEEPDHKSLMTIIAQALDLEQQAEKTYTELAGKIDIPLGHKMFARLAEEEHIHYRILSEAFWALNELGTWKWSTEDMDGVKPLML